MEVSPFLFDEATCLLGWMLTSLTYVRVQALSCYTISVILYVEPNYRQKLTIRNALFLLSQVENVPNQSTFVFCEQNGVTESLKITF